MPVLIDSKQYFEGVTLSQEQFYQKLRDGKVNVSTSQPNPFDVEELWTEILKTHDALVHIPMSSGLSETCSTLSHLAHEKFDKRVFVADNQRISVTQKQSVRDAVKMAAEGKSAEEICSRLVETRAQSSIYIMVDTLKYLKKGGRLPRRRGNRHAAQNQAHFADSGTKAGQIRKGPQVFRREKNHA